MDIVKCWIPNLIVIMVNAMVIPQMQIVLLQEKQ